MKLLYYLSISSSSILHENRWFLMACSVPTRGLGVPAFWTNFPYCTQTRLSPRTLPCRGIEGPEMGFEMITVVYNFWNIDSVTLIVIELFSFYNNFWPFTWLNACYFVMTRQKPLIIHTWLVWLSELSMGLWTKVLPVWFPVRAHAWVAARSPVGGMREATTHWHFSSSLSPSLPLCPKINKIFF